MSFLFDAVKMAVVLQPLLQDTCPIYARLAYPARYLMTIDR